MNASSATLKKIKHHSMTLPLTLLHLPQLRLETSLSHQPVISFSYLKCYQANILSSHVQTLFLCSLSTACPCNSLQSLYP